MFSCGNTKKIQKVYTPELINYKKTNNETELIYLINYGDTAITEFDHNTMKIFLSESKDGILVNLKIIRKQNKIGNTN